MKKKGINISSQKKSNNTLLQNFVKPIIPEFKLKDALQVIIGASILAVPVGFTQETWDLGTSLPTINVIGLFALTVLFIAMFTHYQYHKHAAEEHTNTFIKRVLFTYIFAFIIVALILSLINQAPWTTDWVLAVKRVVIVTFPASLSGAIADTLK